MVDAAPFTAVRYDPQVAGDPSTTSAPAYDDLEPLTYARHRAASPYTVLELVAGSGSPLDYAAAGAALTRWRRTGVLVRERRPAFYLYEEHELRGGIPTVQRGVLAAVGLEPLDGAGAVLPHEAVDADRVEGRLERLAAAPVDVAPVFALYRGEDRDLAALLERRPRHPPVVAMTDEHGVDHRIWALDQPDEIAVVRHGLAPVRAVIADGHHRYAAALSLADRLGLDGAPPAAGEKEFADEQEADDAPWARTLMYLVDARAHGPQVLPIHRLVDGVGSTEALDAMFARSAGPGRLEELVRLVEDTGGGAVGLVTSRGAELLLPRDRDRLAAGLPPGQPPQWRYLAAALIDHVVVPALRALRVTPRADVEAAAAAARSSPGSALFVLPPIGAEAVMDLAMAGAPLPAKTTWFRPKPRMGLLLRDVLAVSDARA